MQKLATFLLMITLIMMATSCSKVPAGNVGIKVYLLGSDKGEFETLKTGRYWIGINEELYLFPIFQQNYVWTKTPNEGSPEDESITFQTDGGLVVNGDFGISYSIDPDKIKYLFKKYRKGIEEITDIFLRNMVRDALNEVAEKMSIEDMYKNKSKMVKEAESIVKKQVIENGIIINKLYVIGQLRFPKSIVEAISKKIEAKQIAEKMRNELKQAEYAKDKVILEAQANAEEKRIGAEAEAKALEIRAKVIGNNPELIKYEAIKKWDGKLPIYSNELPKFIQLDK